MKKLNKSTYKVLIVMGILGIADTIGLLFYTNINFGILLPGLIGALFIAYAYLKLKVYRNEHIIKNNVFRNLIKIIIIFAIISFVIVEALIIYCSKSDKNKKADYLIILGAGLKGETVSLTLKGRLDKGIDYLNKYKDAKVVVSGGRGFGENITEAEAMKKYLIKNGIDINRIITEDKSSSTMENFKYSKNVLYNIKGNKDNKIMIITSDFHMLRSKMLARRNGFNPYGITCSTPISVRLNNYMREYFALIKSYFLDK